MKKVAIITITSYLNYGNRLQNYALQEVIRQLGFAVETIRVDRAPWRPDGQPRSPLYRLLAFRKRPVRDLVRKIWQRTAGRISARLNRPAELSRKETFRRFSREHIQETPGSIADSRLPADLAEQYDAFVAGSDQIWNPNYMGGSGIFFLTFAPRRKRITYAASFGIEAIPQPLRARYSAWLGEIAQLSLREDSGAALVRELTGREAPVHLDPTLLLSQDQWLALSRPAAGKPKGRYLLCYFLGGQSGKHRRQIRAIARQNGLAIVSLDKKCTCGPDVFIDWIRDCSLLCTDSFHGTVFAILLEKPFIVYERAGSLSMYGRISTLLDTFGLQGRNIDAIRLPHDVFAIDYEPVRPILEAEKKRALAYLEKALAAEPADSARAGYGLAVQQPVEG